MTIFLTKNADNLVGGPGNDVFEAVPDSDNVNQNAVSTLNADDTINGGIGFNTFVLVGAENTFGGFVNNAILGTITNIQKLVVTGVIDDSTAIDASKIGGLQQIWIEDPRDFGLQPADFTLTPNISNITAAQTVTIDTPDAIGLAAFDYAAGATSGQIDFTKNGLVALQVAGAALKTLNLDFQGTSSSGAIDFLQDTGSGAPLTTLNIQAGTSRVVIFNGEEIPLLNAIGSSQGSTGVSNFPPTPGFATLTTVNISGQGGGWVDLANNTQNVTFNGSAGPDAVLVDPANTNANDHFNGGAGMDIFALSFLHVASSAKTLDPGSAGYAAINAATSFEEVGFIGDFVRPLVIDAAQILHQHTFIVGQSSQISNLTDADKIDFQLNSFADIHADFMVKHAVDAQGHMTGTGLVSVMGADILAIGPLIELFGFDSVPAATGDVTFDNKSFYSTLDLSGTYDVTVDSAATWTDANGVAHGVTIDASGLHGTVTVKAGTALADTFTSGLGTDSFAGGAGNDTYRVNSAGDLVTDAFGGGSDTVFSSVSYALQAGQAIELLATTSAAGTTTINLTGNDLAQQINGNAGANILNGGGGADTLLGLGGNDTYIVDNVADRVFEASGGGTDTVYASVTYTLSPSQSVEVLSTISAAGTTALHLTGNALAQIINGNAGANVLNDGGAGGADTMSGLAGNDAYLVANAADQVDEALGGGADTVFASVSYALKAAQAIEVLTTNSIAGTAAINLTGNDLSQTINGNNGINGLIGGAGNDTLNGFGGNDRLIGGAGHDVLDGGDGNDTMVYFGVSDSTGVMRDLIMNMSLTNGDKFQFTVKPLAIDAEVTHGGLSAVNFDANLAQDITAAQLAAHHAVLFDPETGDQNIAGHVFLIVDANGVAGYQAGQDYVVELANATGTLTLGDFV